MAMAWQDVWNCDPMGVCRSAVQWRAKAESLQNPTVVVSQHTSHKRNIIDWHPHKNTSNFSLKQYLWQQCLTSLIHLDKMNLFVQSLISSEITSLKIVLLLESNPSNLVSDHDFKSQDVETVFCLHSKPRPPLRLESPLTRFRRTMITILSPNISSSLYQAISSTTWNLAGKMGTNYMYSLIVRFFLLGSNQQIVLQFR